MRPKIATIDFDFGMTYFAYPGERLPGETNGINYWEAVIRGDRSIGEQVRVAGGYAYSPNVSNTGAWSQYLAAGVGFDVPGRLLPQNLTVSFTTAAGYSWFGNQNSATRRLPVACLSQLADGRDLHAQGLQPRSTLLRHQSVKRELLCLYRRSKCAAGWPR